MKWLRQGMLIFIVTLVGVSSVEARMRDLEESELKEERARATKLYAEGDVQGLLTLLKQSHPFVAEEAARMLGRLGATSALEELRNLNAYYSSGLCWKSGAFGVAIILIENADTNTQKSALLRVATLPRRNPSWASSVVDDAGRELSRFAGDDIERSLASVGTYGAEYTVLSFQCRRLAPSSAIARCIAVLEAHETPMKAEAAQCLLVAFGRAAEAPVRDLKEKVEKKIKPTDSTFTIPKTILSRCERILKQIDEDELAKQPSNGTR
jgi:hypothetical protein